MTRSLITNSEFADIIHGSFADAVYDAHEISIVPIVSHLHQLHRLHDVFSDYNAATAAFHELRNLHTLPFATILTKATKRGGDFTWLLYVYPAPGNLLIEATPPANTSYIINAFAFHDRFPETFTLQMQAFLDDSGTPITFPTNHGTRNIQLAFHNRSKARLLPKETFEVFCLELQMCVYAALYTHTMLDARSARLRPLKPNIFEAYVPGEAIFRDPDLNGTTFAPNETSHGNPILNFDAYTTGWIPASGAIHPNPFYERPDVSFSYQGNHQTIIFGEQHHIHPRDIIMDRFYITAASYAFTWKGDPTQGPKILTQTPRPFWLTDQLYGLAHLTAHFATTFLNSYPGPYHRQRLSALNLLADQFVSATPVHDLSDNLNAWLNDHQLPADPVDAANTLISLARHAWHADTVRTLHRNVRDTANAPDSRQMLARLANDIGLLATAYHILTAERPTQYVFRGQIITAHPARLYWLICALTSGSGSLTTNQINLLTIQDLITANPQVIADQIVHAEDPNHTTEQAITADWEQTVFNQTVDDSDRRDLAEAFNQVTLAQLDKESQPPYLCEGILHPSIKLTYLYQTLNLNHARIVIKSTGIWFCAVRNGTDLNFSLAWWSPQDDNLALMFTDHESWIVRTYLTALWFDACTRRERVFQAYPYETIHPKTKHGKRNKVILLPRETQRIEWHSPEDASRIEERGSHTKTPHKRSSTYRRLAPWQKAASQKAIDKAKSDDELPPPPGWTYVREYHTGLNPPDDKTPTQILARGWYTTHLLFENAPDPNKQTKRDLIANSAYTLATTHANKPSTLTNEALIITDDTNFHNAAIYRDDTVTIYASTSSPALLIILTENGNPVLYRNASDHYVRSHATLFKTGNHILAVLHPPTDD